MYAQGLVVIERKWLRPGDGNKARRAYGWTLHRAECFHVKRTTGKPVMPAPRDPYDGTVPCRYCKPEQE